MKPTGSWYTPQPLFDELERRFGPFDLDAAADALNAKCARFITEEENALESAWVGTNVWCNPPYKGLLAWCVKAREELAKNNCKSVCMLLPAQTSTQWFHDHAKPFGELYFIRGKVQFGGCKDRAIMPSVVVVFRQGSIYGGSYSTK